MPRRGSPSGPIREQAGLKLLRITSLTRHPELHGELLCAKAQALTLQGRFEAALTCLDEAVLRLRELDDYQLEAPHGTLKAVKFAPGTYHLGPTPG
eukprot:Skav210010  [mRNA]  locus=scaffold1212:39067:40596:- [translate_table: standard]